MMIYKDEIRRIIKIRRSAMSKDEVLEKSSLAAKVFLSSDIYKNCKQLMIYMPLGNETDTSDIVKAAFSDGKTLVFPVTDAKSGEITPYYAAEDTEFVRGTFSILEPRGTILADMSKTDVVVVPGIAFDKKGVRLGFGKGCYDKFLENSSAVNVGLCYDFQICDKIPPQAHDIKMDFLITESGLIDCKC